MVMGIAHTFEQRILDDEQWPALGVAVAEKRRGRQVHPLAKKKKTPTRKCWGTERAAHADDQRRKARLDDSKQFPPLVG